MASFIFEVNELNSIYIYDGPFQEGLKGYPLIREVAARHCKECGYTYNVMEAEILREDKGKPHFSGVPLEFSLTHSGKLWMCMISDKPCGLDLQQVKACRFEQIAARKFTEAEQHYVYLWGQEGFFDLWVRKEAFCKCTGQGFFTDIPAMVDGSDQFLEQVEWGGKEYFFLEIVISDQLKCMVCTEEKTDVEMRILG